MEQESRSIFTAADQKQLKEKDSNLSAPRSESSTLKTVPSLGFFPDLENSLFKSNLNLDRMLSGEKPSNELCGEEGDQGANSRFKLQGALQSSSNSKNNRKSKNKKKDACLEILSVTYIDFLRKREDGLCAHRFRQFLLRRNCQGGNEHSKRIDLGVCNLSEVLALVRQKYLITRNLYNSFELSSFQDIETLFIEKVKTKNVQLFNFSKYSFTPFDHRMLVQTLTNLYPFEFTYPSHPTVFDPSTTVFYEYLYSLPSVLYWDIFDLLNEKFQRTWMPQQRGFLQSFLESRRTDKNFMGSEESYLFDKSERKLRKKS